MRIVEKYPSYMKMFRARGAWKIFKLLTVPLSWIYAGVSSRPAGKTSEAVQVDQGRRGAGRDKRPFVISVGNIEAGGGGKTPCSIAIAEELAFSGRRAAVVTRGYKSISEKLGRTVVVPPEKAELDGGLLEKEAATEGKEGEGINAARVKDAGSVFGDEVLLYRERGIPVVIDSDRERGIEAAVSAFDPTHIILDDGFQQRSVKKDLDILLLDWKRPFGNGRVLPAGTLRENPRGALRADAVIFTRSEGDSIPVEARWLSQEKKVLFAREQIDGLVDREGRSFGIERIRGRKAVLFSGIARPEAFEKTVQGSGSDAAVSYRFPDHHAYTAVDIKDIIESEGGDKIYLTTEKDSSKVFHLIPSDIEAYFIRIKIEIDGLAGLLEEALRH